jgi:hypothetical protein
MSIIDEVSKLAALEREIRMMGMLIAFVSSLAVDELAKVLPRVTKALEGSSSVAEERLLPISVAFPL